MPAPTLTQGQQLFWKLITAPEGAADGLARLGVAERRVAQALVRDAGRLSAVERLDVYADMYFYRLRDSLKEDFGAVCAVIGEGHFHNLITDYLIAHPPSHFSLRYAGQHLPAFVASHPLSDQWPYLRDLACLEWAVMESFDAADAPVLEAATLATVPQERWPELRFEVTPSLRMLHLDWPVHIVWQHTQRGEAVTDLTPSASRLRVWRQDFRVFHRPMDAAESAALTAVAAGAPFAEVCEHLAAGDESAGAERALSLLGAWLADGLLAGYRMQP